MTNPTPSQSARDAAADQEIGMISQLRVPCAYQGGKQRVAAQIVDLLLEANPGPNSRFYDLCCGSAARLIPDTKL